MAVSDHNMKSPALRATLLSTIPTFPPALTTDGHNPPLAATPTLTSDSGSSKVQCQSPGGMSTSPIPAMSRWSEDSEDRGPVSTSTTHDRTRCSCTSQDLRDNEKLHSLTKNVVFFGRTPGQRSSTSSLRKSFSHDTENYQKDRSIRNSTSGFSSLRRGKTTSCSPTERTHTPDIPVPVDETRRLSASLETYSFWIGPVSIEREDVKRVASRRREHQHQPEGNDIGKAAKTSIDRHAVRPLLQFARLPMNFDSHGVIPSSWRPSLALSEPCLERNPVEELLTAREQILCGRCSSHKRCVKTFVLTERFALRYISHPSSIAQASL